MTLNQRFSIVALLLLGLNAQAKTDAAFLEAVGDVETGHLTDQRNAIGRHGERGKYQMKSSAWADANIQLQTEGRPTYSWYKWRDSTAQDMMACAYLRCLRKRLLSLGIANPSPALLALCWNRGVTGARNLNWQPNDYAVRVANLFELQKTPQR
jgi:hypothetical protein